MYRTIYGFLGAVFAMSLAPALGFGQITFTRVADTNTPVPAGSGNFSDLTDFDIASNDGTNVVFTNSPYYTGGVYSFNIASQALARVADIGNFQTQVNDNTEFSYATVSNGTAAFVYDNFGQPNQLAFQSGVYSGSAAGGSALTTIANTNTLVPNTKTKFTFFGNGSAASAGHVAFSAFTNAVESQGGIYAAPITGGTITKVVDTSTVIPGFGTVSDVPDQFSLHNQFVAFASGSDTNDHGILVASLGGGTPKLVADLNTPVPGKTGTFTSLYAPALDDSNVAFVGEYGSAQSGIFEYSFGGSYSQTIADTATRVPGHSFNFDSFSYGYPQLVNGIALDGSSVIFSAYGGGQTVEGVYADTGGVLSTILESGAALDGRTVANVEVTSSSVAGNEVGLIVTFTDNSEGIYLASVPEPASLATLCLGGLGLLMRRRANRF